MITDILGGKTGAADAASSAKQAVAGRKGSDTSPGGFSSALSNYDRDVPPHEADDAQPDDIQEDEPEHSSDQDRLTADPKTSKPKPIIDIRPESLVRAQDLRTQDLRAQDLRAQEVLAKDGLAQSKADAAADAQTPEQTKGDDRHLTPAEKKLRDALLAAKMIARRSDELQGKDVAASDKQTADVQSGDADLDMSILAADDAKIADVLAMLTGGELKPGDLGMPMPKNLTGPQAKRDRDIDDGAREVGSLVIDDPKRFSLAGNSATERTAMPTDPNAEVPGTRTFRFTNARSEGQSLDMAIEARGERMAAEFKTATNSGAENVTVLDSRRFLGLAPASNGANLAALISGDSEWAAAMQPSSALSNAAAQSSTGTVVNMLKLQMNPHDLGSVTATLRLHGEQLNVHLTVETRAAYRQLSEDGSGIMDALRAQGFSVDQMTISIAPTADSDQAGGQQSQSGQAGQQGAAEGGKQGFAAGRGQGQADDRQKTDQGARTANDAVSDNTQHPASGGARPDQLYL